MIENKVQDKKRALGRGLESLIPKSGPAKSGLDRGAHTSAAEAGGDEAAGERVVEIPLEEIEPSPYQPRRHHQDETALAELAASIRAQGVLQPIVVRYIPDGRRSMVDGDNPGAQPAAENSQPAALSKIKYQLIAGERRWRASRMAGRATVPAIVRQVSNEQAMEMALIENIQREDLNCLEMAYAFERLGNEFGLTQEEMSLKTGKGRSDIGNYLRLVKLPPDVRAALARRDLSFGHAKALMAIEDPGALSQAAEKVMRELMSVRATEELVNHVLWLKSGALQKPVPKYEDPNVKAARMALESRLGCRVKILDHKGKGKVVIEYKSLEDFDRIMEALK